MKSENMIPAFGLYGEENPFPDVIHCESFQARAPEHGWHILAHRHEHMAQLFMMDIGHADCVVDGRKLVLEDGHFLFVASRSVHEFNFEPGMQGHVISFPASVLSSIGPNAGGVLAALSRPFFGTSSTQLAGLVSHLLDIAKANTPFRAQQAVGLAHAVLAVLAELEFSDQADQKGAKPERLFDLDALIAQHMASGWAVSDYAAALSVSTGHLSRLCRSATGQGAAAYLEHRVMEEACRMLAFTQLPVSEIGYRLGYSDPSYFSKRFRHICQTSPRDYRTRFIG